MGCLAVLFALNEQELETFLNVERTERAYYMHNEIEENFWNDFPEYEGRREWLFEKGMYLVQV